MKLEEIFSGWANLIKDRFDKLDPSIKLQAEERLAHCNRCYMRTNNRCDPDKVGINLTTNIPTKGCGCYLSAKCLSPCSKCPLDIWGKMEECKDKEDDV